MEYILLSIVIVFFSVGTGLTVFFSYFFANKFVKEIKKDIDDYSQTVNGYSKIQKDNTEKVVNLLNGAFVPTKESPNIATKKDEKSIDFSESTVMEIPKDVKLEVEGGDSTPPGYTQN